MKKNCFLIAFTVLLFILNGCTSNNPESAARSFLEAFNENDFEEARKYATPETGKLIDLMENLAKLSDEKMESGEFEIVDSRIDGDKAYVTYRETDSDGTTELMLKKVDGDWLVHITKEDIATKGLLGSPDEEDGLFDDEHSEETAPGGIE